jgi:predicted amidohydrolase YtcJ
MIRISLFLTALAGALLISSSVLAQQGTAAAAETIYLGGPIVTMVSDGDVAEAIAMADGKIIAVGTQKDIMTMKGQTTKVVNLQGRTLMPGFIDAHSHVVQQALKFSVVNLDPKPIGDVETIADVQRKLRQRINERKAEPGQWIIGWGYDDTGLREMRHPNRDDLDAVSKEHPILLMHISSHLMTANSKALEIAGISADK